MSACRSAGAPICATLIALLLCIAGAATGADAGAPPPDTPSVVLPDPGIESFPAEAPAPVAAEVITTPSAGATVTSLPDAPGATKPSLPGTQDANDTLEAAQATDRAELPLTTAGETETTPPPAPKPKRAPGKGWSALEILGTRVQPGTRIDLHWTAGQSFAGSAIETPFTVIRGRRRGPTLCLTAAVHGDELNGVEIVRRVLAEVDPSELKGTLIGAPIVNLLGFSRGSRYLPDRRDLNRYFPGDPNGSTASRIAYVFFNEVIRHCERLVDFHTGSFKRTNLPQLRANLKNPAVREFVERFGATSVLQKVGYSGTLRNAATTAGIPAVTFELGEPGTLQLGHVRFGIKVLDTLLDKLGMVERFRLWSEPQPIFYRSHWLRAYRGGILTSSIRVGARVHAGDVLGVVINPLTNEKSEILSPHDGRLLGRALNQFVLPGFATFHIGIETAAIATLDKALPDEEAGYDQEGADDADDDIGDEGPEARSVAEDLIEDIVDEELH